MATPNVVTPAIQTPPIPLGAGSAAVPSIAPARASATHRDGSNSLGTFGVCISLPFLPKMTLSVQIFDR
jgi:hypothetical protein